jgi:hypothetical protein
MRENLKHWPQGKEVLQAGRCEWPKAPSSLAPATCWVAAVNNTDVIITSTGLAVEQRNNPDNQMSAALTKEQAARIIKALSECFKIEPPNIQS